MPTPAETLIECCKKLDAANLPESKALNQIYVRGKPAILNDEYIPAISEGIQLINEDKNVHKLLQQLKNAGFLLAVAITAVLLPEFAGRSHMKKGRIHQAQKNFLANLPQEHQTNGNIVLAHTNELLEQIEAFQNEDIENMLNTLHQLKDKYVAPQPATDLNDDEIAMPKRWFRCC